MLLNKTEFIAEKPCCLNDVSWPTSDFEGHNLFGLDEVDDLLVDAGGDGVSIDAHNLVTNLLINKGCFITDDTFTVNISFQMTDLLHQNVTVILAEFIIHRVIF